MSKTKQILGSLDPNTMRVIFLYVGQGESTLLQVPDGIGGHRSMLIDCNRAPGSGIDLPAFLKDVLPAKDGRPFLDLFVNTHPHSDHLAGLDLIRAAVRVDSVWHSGHKPGKDHDGPYQELQALIREVEKRGGEVRRLEGSRTPLDFGLAKVHVVSPAEYVSDDIDGESPEDRYRRIHEQCAVLRVGYGGTRVLVTGDSDKTAWKDHITDYHGRGTENRIASEILSASHHGSYTFFKDRKDDPEPYTEHLDVIAPTHVIVSAPDQKDSKHEHPDDDAMARYRKKVGDANVHHMGSRAFSFAVDARQGGYDLFDDHGDLAREFPLEDGGADKEEPKQEDRAPAVISRVERSRPMG